ncbi:MAG: hypothetical protein HQ465_07060 [Rhodospirillales bacterium]|nr:hypothetical protein [Rhodospirillales bacterium]
MKSVALTVRDLRPQPIVKAKRAPFLRWRQTLDRHWRELADERTVNNRGETTCRNTLRFIDEQLLAISTDGGKDVLLEAGKFWYLLVNIELAMHRVKSQNDDLLRAAKLQRLAQHIKRGYGMAQWTRPFLKLRGELQKAVTKKDEAAHLRILKQWHTAHGR